MTVKWKVAYVICSVITMNACSGNAYLSQKATQDFRADGQRSEWTGRFQIPEDESFALGVSHDKNYIYVAISSIDKDFQRQLALRGFTLWLDSKGAKHKNLGLQYEGAMAKGRRPGAYKREQSQGGGQLRRKDNSAGLSGIQGDLTIVVIDTKAGKSLGPADLLASATSDNETLFIEFQIPLAMLGERFDKNKKLGLGIVSVSERPDMRDGQNAGMQSGPRGRSGGMGSGRQGGGRQSGVPSRSGMGQNDLDVWMRIQLAP